MKHVVILTGMALLAAGCQQVQPPAADPRIDALARASGHRPARRRATIRTRSTIRTGRPTPATYTEDGELLLGDQKAQGRQGIIDFLSALPADERVIHVISNSSYVIKGDSATGGAYWQDIGDG